MGFQKINMKSRIKNNRFSYRQLHFTDVLNRLTFQFKMGKLRFSNNEVLFKEIQKI
jgi:hypothetical protein